MNDAPLFDLNIGELAERKMLAGGRRDQQIPDGVGILAVRLLHAHQQIELALALNHLRGRFAAHRGLDHGVDVVHVQPVLGDLLAVRA